MSDTVTVSPKFQVVIPRRIRESLGIEPGQKLEAILYAGRIELVPRRSLGAARGWLKGLDTTIERDDDRT
jgi:AbrB family looped-hinge helix DNA binding protein